MLEVSMEVVSKHSRTCSMFRFVAHATAYRPISPVRSVRPPMNSPPRTRGNSSSALSSFLVRQRRNRAPSAHSSRALEKLPGRRVGNSTTVGSRSLSLAMASSSCCWAFPWDPRCTEYTACLASFWASRQPLMTVSRAASAASMRVRRSAHSAVSRTSLTGWLAPSAALDGATSFSFGSMRGFFAWLPDSSNGSPLPPSWRRLCS
mmetsp:Transcript_16184/g.47522  ORF Transcript_16184/g.47522 Transcript_16184/m.47522 type:complete len:205 (-) Transcript_16184:380-994(-)